MHYFENFIGNFLDAGTHSAAPPGFRFGGNTLGGRPHGWSGGRSPQDAGEISKIFKKFLKRIAKNVA